MHWLTYRLWLFFGGRRTEENFLVLCKSIESNRKLIGEQSSRINDLETRVWELEGHTGEEYLAEAERRVRLWEEAVKQKARL